MLTFGSLFAGIGGFDLGFERAGMRCEWQVEINEFCRRVLAKHWPDVRRWDDVRTFPPEPIEQWRVDVICGGFPCIDISSSGKKAGIGGAYSGLWSEFARIIRQLRPSIVVVENVADIVHRGLGDVLAELATCGMDGQWEVLPAFAFGIPQRRERMFLVAHSHGWGREGSQERHGERPLTEGWNYRDGLALAERRAGNARSWVRRADDGIPGRVDRLRACGNAVVPQVAEWIGRRIVETQEKIA